MKNVFSNPPPARLAVLSRPIKHQNLDEVVYARVKDMLASGELEPGQRIVQEDMAAGLEVSRTPLVNALKRLAQEGLLEWVPRRGIYVRALGLDELVHLFEVRERLEPLAAELAAVRISPKEAGELQALWHGMRGLADTPESRKLFVDRDRSFHWRLAELSANPYLMTAMAPMNMLAAAYLHGTPRPWEDTVPDHLAVIDGLRRRDPAAAGQAMRRHIAQSLEALRREAQAQPETARS